MTEQAFGHEPSGIAVRPIVLVGAATAVAVIFTVTIVCLVLRGRMEPTRAVNRGSIAAIPPPPRLQAQPRIDLAALRAEKQGVLQSWGWADHSGQFAHIPIERAMEIYAQQHAASPRAGAVKAAADDRGRP